MENSITARDLLMAASWPFTSAACMLLRGDVGGVFYHLERLAARIEDGVVACLQPKLAAAFGNALVLPAVIIAAAELFPEQAVFGTLAEDRVHEHAVMLTAHLLQRVAGAVQEVCVRRHDAAVQREGDHRLRLADRRKLTVEIRGLCLLRCDVRGVFDDLVRACRPGPASDCSWPAARFPGRLWQCACIARCRGRRGRACPRTAVIGSSGGRRIDETCCDAGQRFPPACSRRLRGSSRWR